MTCESRRRTAAILTAGVTPRASDAGAAELRVARFALGPMTAAPRLPFAVIHFEHHATIARESVHPA